MMSDVWVMESGDYEQSAVYGVFTSVETAQAYLVSTFADPYRVTWDEPLCCRGGSIVFAGHFEQVAGWSTRHVGYYEVTRYTLDA